MRIDRNIHFTLDDPLYLYVDLVSFSDTLSGVIRFVYLTLNDLEKHFSPK